MIKIRLSRGGRKAVPFYRILATNSTSPRDSKFLEKLGTYNPLLGKSDEKRVTIDKERVEYWLSVGAQPTEKVAKFLTALGVKGSEKHKPNFKPKKKGDGLKKKALEKLAKEKEASAAAAEAAKASEAAPKTEENPA
jgi:small subunit ribosomal protein S16